MTKEIRLNTILWVLLIVLICASMLFSEKGFAHAYLLIASMSIVKFLSVCFQFIEVKHAHIVWKLLSILFAVVYLIGVIALY